jgi:hypothetical protein
MAKAIKEIRGIRGIRGIKGAKGINSLNPEFAHGSARPILHTYEPSDGSSKLPVPALAGTGFFFQ